MKRIALHLVRIVDEARRVVWSQRTSSVMSIVLIAAMTCAILLTTGRTVGAQRQVVASIDSAGTRSIVVTASGASDLDTTVLDRLQHVAGISWLGAFSPAVDVQNAGFLGGAKVGFRTVYTDDLTVFGADVRPRPNSAPTQLNAWGSQAALRTLGLADGVGGVADEDSRGLDVVGAAQVPEYVQFLEPLLIAPQDRLQGGPHDIAILVLVAERADLVAGLTDVLTSVLGVSDPTTVSLATSQAFFDLRGLVEDQLSTFSRAFVAGVTIGSGVLVGAITYGFVLLRRKDFGRRRALGANRGLIVALVLTQTAILSIVGSVIGVAVSLAISLALGDPLPTWQFFVAVATLSTVTGVLAAIVPAATAARRDPLRELRVP